MTTTTFKSEILTSNFDDLLDDDCYQTILRCESTDEDYINSNFAEISLDCADGEIDVYETGRGWSEREISGIVRTWRLPKLAARVAAHEFLCEPDIIELLEIVFNGCESDYNNRYTLNDDAQNAYNKLEELFMDCDIYISENEEPEEEEVELKQREVIDIKKVICFDHFDDSEECIDAYTDFLKSKLMQEYNLEFGDVYVSATHNDTDVITDIIFADIAEDEEDEYESEADAYNRVLEEIYIIHGDEYQNFEYDEEEEDESI